MDRFVKFD